MRLEMCKKEAFRRLQKLANDSNCKLLEVARTILGAEEIFQLLEKT